MAVLKRSVFKRVTDVADCPREFFENNQAIERITFDGIEFDGWKFNHSLLKSCEFHGCRFSGCIFDRMDFQRVSFRQCTFSDCMFSPDFRFITGEMIQCSVQDCDFSGAFFQNVKWSEGAIIGSSFERLKAKSIAFHGTSLAGDVSDHASITGGDFRTVPNLRREVFYTAKLDDCDFAWNEAFVVMQYGDAHLDNLYDYGIFPVLNDELGIDCRRVDRYEFKGRITDEILQNIMTARIIVAECSAANKNVFFELGYALGRGKEIIFLVDEPENIPFDLKDYKFLVHHNRIDSLKDQLRKRTAFVLGAE